MEDSSLKLTKDNIGPWLEKWHRARHKARTNLLHLCNNVLGYKDVSQRVHGPILDALQKFDGVRENHKTVQDFTDCFQKNKVLFEPVTELWHLQGPRKNLFLYPRGHLKSTVITIAHSVQWIINYPDIRILISSATGNQIVQFVTEIKGHFLANDTFRFLFPEFCPATGKAQELGNSEQFTVPCRKPRKEPTVYTATVGKVLAGGHYDVHKNDDLVDRVNSGTPGSIEEVKQHFGMLTPLLETSEFSPGYGWRDIAGTIYDFSDLYCTLMNGEQNLPEERRSWNIVMRSAAPNWPDGPYLWPERMGYKSLKEIEDDPTAGPQVLFSQYLMKPIVAGRGLIEDESEIRWIPRRKIDEIYAALTLFATLDLAGMDTAAKGSDNDYSCLSVGGFGRDGRLYLSEILHGRVDVFQIIDWIFSVFDRHPRLVKLKVEKEAHARVLLPFLQKEMARRERFLPIDAQPRDNQQSKKDKIRGLQPWFKQGAIIFAEDLPCRSFLINEIKGFPKYTHDDILDTVVDLMHERQGVNSEVMGRPKYEPDRELTVYERYQRVADSIEQAQMETVFMRVDEHGAVDALTGF